MFSLFLLLLLASVRFCWLVVVVCVWEKEKEKGEKKQNQDLAFRSHQIKKKKKKKFMKRRREKEKKEKEEEEKRITTYRCKFFLLSFPVFNLPQHKASFFFFPVESRKVFFSLSPNLEDTAKRERIRFSKERTKRGTSIKMNQGFCGVPQRRNLYLKEHDGNIFTMCRNGEMYFLFELKLPLI